MRLVYRSADLAQKPLRKNPRAVRRVEVRVDVARPERPTDQEGRLKRMRMKMIVQVGELRKVEKATWSNLEVLGYDG